MKSHRVIIALLAILTLVVTVIGRGSTVEAVQVPPIGTPFYIQTSSPGRGLGIGDWYTNSNSGAGNGYHYFTLHVPCGWPSGTPIHIDLFHPDLNGTSGGGVADEIIGTITTSYTTVFEVYQPGTPLNPPTQPGPLATGSMSQVIYNQNTVGPNWTRFFTITAPVTCGTYILRAQTNGNADNSWRLRFGSDNDNDPTTLPPTNYDNPDGLPGTGDELTIGLSATTFQHDASGTPCLTLYEYVAPGQSSVTFHNFDMDGQTRVRYYSPIDVYDSNGLTGGTAGALSANAVWNNSTTSARVGDTITSPTPGWWRIVSCINNNNQFIQEGQTSVLSYMGPPPAPHLTLSKTDGVTVAAPGDIITYTLTFTNTGNPITSPGAAYNVILTDTLPAQVIYINHDAPNGILTHSSGTVVYTRTNQLNYNETDTITITVQVDPSLTSTVTFTNTAVLDYQDGFGNQYPQVQASDSVTINQPNIVLSKTDGVTTAAPGQTLTYTLTFTNTGLAPAHNITISDVLPSALISATCTPGSLGGTCTVSGSSVTYIAPTTATLGVGQSSTITITAQVSSTLTSGATLTNTATLDYTDSANNARPSVTASDTTTVPAQPNIVLSKTDGVTTAAPGQTLTYTLTFTNTGAGAAHNITISDVLPSALISATCTPGSLGGTCSVSGSSVTYTAPTTATLGVGQSSTITITAQVPSTLTSGATLTNTATLNYTDSANNARPSVTASDTTTVPAQPNIVLSKTDGVTTAAPGQTLTYTLTFTNTGVGAAHNITISDVLPAGVSYQSCNAGALGGTCSASGGVVTFTLTNPLPAGGSASVTITVVVTASGPATLTNTATLNYTDSGGNVRPSVTASDTTTVPAQPNIVLSKTDGVTTAAPGQTLTYTLTFTNTGAGAAHNITISDVLPAGVSYQSCDAGTLGGTCGVSGGTVTFTLTNPLAAGSSASVTITVVVTASGPATLTNTATLNYTDSGGNARPSVSASDTTTVPAQPNIVLSKTDGVTTAAPGQSLTYTLTFTNTGAGAAHNITISDVLPAGVSYQSCDAGTLGGTCGVSGGVVTFTLTNPLAAGGSASVTITVVVTAGGPATLTNTATLNYTDSGGNVRPSVTASDTTTVPAQPTIVLSKTDGVTTAAPGQTLTYTLTFTNTGAGAAHNITISDVLPSALISATCTPGSLGGICSVSGSSVTYIAPTTATLGAGQSSTITITAQVPITLTSGATLTNTATLNYTDSGGNAQTPVTSSDTTRIPGPTAVDLIKRATLVVDSNNDDRAGSGDVIEYTIVMTNTGSEPALLLTVADTPDVNTTLIVGSVLVTPTTAVVVSGNSLGDTAVEVTLNELAINNSLTITFRVRVNASLPDNVSEIANQATASGANISSTPSDDPTTTVPDDPTRLRTPPPGGPPTAIILTEFRLVATSTGWDILWSTGAEVNTRGFLIYRSTASRDKAQLLTPLPIPARGSSTSGASYRFSDQTALVGIDYSYWLVEIELDGTFTEYGPLQSRGTINQQYRYFIPLIGR